MLRTGARSKDAEVFRLLGGKGPSANPHKYRLDWLDDHKDFDGAECLLFPGAMIGRPVRVSYNFKEMAAARAMLLKTQGLPKNAKSHAAHKCGNGHLSCVNPAHLYWATPSQNAQDRAIHDDSDITKYEVDEDKAARIKASGDMDSVVAHNEGLPVALVKEIRR